jgi:hypothetical protein
VPEHPGGKASQFVPDSGPTKHDSAPIWQNSAPQAKVPLGAVQLLSSDTLTPAALASQMLA